MPPSRGAKRKRSLSPVNPQSPEVKKGKFSQLLNFLTPSKAAEQKKKRLSFGAPVVHAFDAFSPPCRRCPLHDNASLDAQALERESLRVELECRREEDEIEVNIDLQKASQKSMAKIVNQLWNRDQLAKLEDWGVLNKGDDKLSRADLSHKISVLHGLERKASVLMGGEHPVLPAHMDMGEIKDELRSRRIDTKGRREVLERRLEEAWIKEGLRLDLQGEDGYAFGRHAVTAYDLVEEMSDAQLREELAKPQWNLKKKDIPKKRADRLVMLEGLYASELQRRNELAFNIALNDMLAASGLDASGPKALLFQRLSAHLKSLGTSDVDECRGSSCKSSQKHKGKVNETLLQHQNGSSLSSGSALKRGKKMLYT